MWAWANGSTLRREDDLVPLDIKSDMPMPRDMARMQPRRTSVR